MNPPLSDRLVRSSFAFLALAATAGADLTPDWTARLPVGSALAAGISGLVVDGAGVTYVTGIHGPSGNTDVVTAAIGADGTPLWSQSYNGPQDWHDQARGLALGPGGVLWVVGNTPGNGMYANVLLLKYDTASGVLLGSYPHPSAPFTAEYGATVAVDAQGRVFVAGGTVGDSTDVLVLAFDADGRLLWRRTWDGPAAAPYSQDSAREIQLTPGGDPVVLIHGVMETLHPDYVVIRYDAASGATVWETRWGLNGGDFPVDMEIDAAGDVYATGLAFDFTNQFGTIKLRGTDGLLLWEGYDTAGYHKSCRALALDGQGGVYITGSIDPDGDESNLNDDFFTIRRRASDGTRTWTHLYGDDCIGCLDIPGAILADAGGLVYVAGSSSSAPYSGDAFTLVLDAATGVEIDRGAVSGGATEHAAVGLLRLDGNGGLVHGGEVYDVNSGAIDILVFRDPTPAPRPYRLTRVSLVAGQPGSVRVEGATPGRLQFHAYSLTGPGTTPLPTLGVELGLQGPRLLGYGRADGAGVHELVQPVPAGAQGLQVWLQTLERGATTDVVTHTVQ